MKDKAQSVIETFRALDHQMAGTQDPARLMELAKERKRLEPVVHAAQEWLRLNNELDALHEMLASPDASLAGLAKEEERALQEQLSESAAELRKLLTPRDPIFDRNAIIEIRPAAGGDEAALFAAELYRMYVRFAQAKNLGVETYSMTPTGIGGLKEVVFGVSGTNAYGWFRFEQGVHRVQRVPKTEAQGRIHTSTVTVAVLPEPTEVEVKVDMKDLRIDTYRASGAGGQHVNKTESAIRITHVPTGIVVACQEERSQGQNRLRAMALLRAKLQEAAEEKQTSELKDMRRKQIGTGDRSEKIRTYNYPQDRITDHRINESVHNIEGFMGGDMDDLIGALESREQDLASGAATA
ncbi:MAG: peptide chain release factor 1 [Elusimicrobia bacterium]|nr:peptide chain release factor 1 [Elusimicrobiota bacterium]